ncbi:MAG: radical SAM protein [Cetobacterium sp.]|uniref:radical SAM/SPASM domain-containing protein n=1 Tax=Cetobacterium sp. TaxID=2071632 RepID=UPI002FC9FACE
MKNKEKKTFKYLVFWIANTCNLSCEYCYAKKNFDGTFLTWGVAEKALDLLDENSTLVLAGGEPLLNFNLIKKIYSHLLAKDFKGKISLQTNGSLITEEIAKELSSMNIKIGISLDGMSEVNELYRGKSIETFSGIKKLEKYGKKVSINAVITNHTVDKLEKLVELCYFFNNVEALGLDLLRIENKSELLVPENENIYMYLKKAYERSLFLESILGRKVAIREIEDARLRIIKNHTSCSYCYSSEGETAVVIPNGDIYPCSSLVNRFEYHMGNILDMNSIIKIKLPNGKYEECGHCPHISYCRGGCPSRLLINKELELDSADCHLRKAVFKILNK